MFADIQREICPWVFCSQKNRHYHLSKVSLLPVSISRPWETATATCMGPLSATLLGTRYIIVIGDLFTKYIHFVTLLSLKVILIAQLFLDMFLCFDMDLHDVSRVIEEVIFETSIMMKEVCNIISLSEVFTTSYNSFCAELIERISGIIT